MKYSFFLFSQIAIFKLFNIGEINLSWFKIAIFYFICYMIEKIDFEKQGTKFAKWVYMAKIRRTMSKEKKEVNKIIENYKKEKPQ